MKYGPHKYYASILGYQTSSYAGNDYPLITSTAGVFDFSNYSSGFSIPFFKMSVKLQSRSNGPLLEDAANGRWQELNFSFLAGKVTAVTQIADFINSQLVFVRASVSSDLRLVLTADRCTSNPDEEAAVDFLVVGGDTRQFDAQRSNLSSNAITSASIFPLSRIGNTDFGNQNICNSGFGFSTSILGNVMCPSIFPNNTSKSQTLNTLGYITCCDGYTPNTIHQRGVWDLGGQTNPIIFIKMFNKSTIIYNSDAPDGLVIPVYSGILAVKFTNKKYTSEEIAYTINLALSEISPCNGFSNFKQACSTADGTIPFKATVSPDGRILICQSFYELSISGSNSYLDYIFSFDKIEENQTCKVRTGYVLSDIPKGCAMSNISEAKTEAEIKSAVETKKARLANFQYEVFDYTPKAIVEKIYDYSSRGISYALAPTLTGPLSNSAYTLGNNSTSITSAQWTANQYISNSQYAEFWTTVNLNEEDIKAAIGHDKNIMKVSSVSASIKASWNYFGHLAGAYITYPFYNWALVLNTSTYCKVQPLKNTDTIYFTQSGIQCRDFGADSSNNILPSWDGNTECLQYIRSRNKSCNTDLAQISTVEIPRIYGEYRIGVVFDWRLWSRYNPNGVNSSDFTGAFAIPTITFKVAYY